MIIEGYFSNLKAANETLEKLKASGFTDALVDMNDHYNENLNVQTNLAGTETGESLSGLVMGSNSDNITMDRRPLSSASPMASGMGHFDEVADVSCKVVVEVPEEQSEQVKQLLSETGGSLDNPNIKKPEFKSNNEIIINNTLREANNFLEQRHSRR